MIALLLLLQNPADLLRDAYRHMERAEGELNDGQLPPSMESQQRAIDAINELIRRAPRSESPAPMPAPSPAVRPPTPVDPPTPDRSLHFSSGNRAWGGRLPPRVREAIHHDERALDDFPAEYKEFIKQYHKVISEEETKRP